MHPLVKTGSNGGSGGWKRFQRVPRLAQRPRFHDLGLGTWTESSGLGRGVWNALAFGCSLWGSDFGSCRI